MDEPTNAALNAHSKHPAFHLSCLKVKSEDLPEKVDTHKRAWKRKPLRFFPDQVKPHVIKLETISFATVFTTTIVRVNDTLYVRHNAGSEERFVVQPTEK